MAGMSPSLITRHKSDQVLLGGLPGGGELQGTGSVSTWEKGRAAARVIDLGRGQTMKGHGFSLPRPQG